MFSVGWRVRATQTGSMLLSLTLLQLLALDPVASFERAQKLRAEATAASLEEAARLLTGLAGEASLDALTRFRVELNLCSVYVEAGDAAAARGRLAKLILPDSAWPSDRAAYLQIQALVARQGGELGRARRLLREAAAKVETAAEEIPLVNTAIAFALEDYELAEAEELTLRLERLLRTHPNAGILAAAPSFYRAQIRYAQGDLPGAMRLLQTHLAQAGGAASLPARYFECDLLEAMGRRKQARELRRSLAARDAESAWVSVKQLAAESEPRRPKREPASSAPGGKR